MPFVCPRDGTELVEVERSGVRIDACRTCRGVWLDRGELDKVLEREAQAIDRRDEDDEAFLREVTGGATVSATRASPASTGGLPSASSRSSEATRAVATALATASAARSRSWTSSSTDFAGGGPPTGSPTELDECTAVGAFSRRDG